MGPTYNMDEARDATLVAWRIQCFELLGVDLLSSAALAVRRDIDRERVERMVKGGATSAQLVAILL